MVLRRKTDNVERALGIGDLLTFETRLTDDVFGYSWPSCVSDVYRPGRNAGSAAGSSRLTADQPHDLSFAHEI